MANSEPLNEKELGQRIKQKRWEAGLTQAELAQDIGVSPQQIQKYESGANRVSATVLHAISLSLGVDVADMYR